MYYIRNRIKCQPATYMLSSLRIYFREKVKATMKIYVYRMWNKRQSF